MTDSFPRQQARTRNFSLGAPRSFQVAPDGGRIAFLRSRAGEDPVTCLWVLDVASSTERLVADPAAIADRAGSGRAGSDEPAEEKARRERARESAAGVVAFATDSHCRVAAFALAGQVYTVSLAEGGAAPEPMRVQSPAIDPRPDPAGQRLAYVCHGALRITDLRSGTDAELIGPGRLAADAGGPDGEADISYGLAEFVAAEEMGRMRGYWWAPDSSALLVARADTGGVHRWHIADPANPDRPPAEIAYPAAGTPNASVSLLVVLLDGTSVPVQIDDPALFPYLVTASWEEGGPLIVVQSRDQRRMRLLAVEPATGATKLLREDTDQHWLDIVPGVPARTADGRIVWTADSDGAKRLIVAAGRDLAAAVPVTPATLQLRSVLSVDGDTVLFSGSDGEPSEVGIWTYGPAGLIRLAAAAAAGVYWAVRAGGTTVLSGRTMSSPAASTLVLRDPPPDLGVAADADEAAEAGRAARPSAITTIASLAARPVLPEAAVQLIRTGRSEIRTALVLPSWHEPGSAKLPVLMDPYGGPHGQRVLASGAAYLTSQWFADQGFAVVIADGRGTPGRGPDWDRAVAGDLASPALADQVDALSGIAERCADLDLGKVAIRGWSFGGYLSALAVLRGPDVFHAAIAGAPVTDWRLYDTHYTERYLGDPATAADAYERSSLLAHAHRLSRPLLLIHGLADDNVVVAHTLRLSAALLAAGRPHSVLPLSGVTHMASQEDVAENMLLLQVDFLRSALDLQPRHGGPPGTAYVARS